MKKTKGALLTSVISLLLCFAMMLGTTFAWFTDSVSSDTNKIVAGNLDIELEYKKVVNGVPTEWDAVAGNSEIFDPNALWEPGRIEVVYLKVSNLGSLALKYQLSVAFEDVVIGKTEGGADVKLSDHLVFKVIEMDDTFETYDTYAEAVAAAGTVKGISDYNGVTKSLEAKDKANDEDYLALIVYMPKEVGNEANYRGTDIPAIELGINLIASQYNAESDSFGPNYDQIATFPGEAATAAELISALQAGKNVKLVSDIDLGGMAWTPIPSYSGVLDGNGYAIKNLQGENGLFDELSGATVKNLKLENVDIDATSNHTGALAGYIVKSAGKTTVIDNVTVSGDINGNAYYVGGVVGADSNYNTVIKNCTNNATVTAPGQQVGGIVGYATRETLVENCVNNGDITGGSFVGGIIGMAAGDDDMPELSIVVKGCSNTGAVAETALDPSVTWQGGVGGIIGNIGRAAGDSAVNELHFYIGADCTVLAGQKVYGQLHNVLGGHANKLNVWTLVDGDAALTDLIKNDLKTEKNMIALEAGTYASDYTFTKENILGSATATLNVGDIHIKAYPGAEVVFTGTTALGDTSRGATKVDGFGVDFTFEGITYKQFSATKQSMIAACLGRDSTDGGDGYSNALTLIKCKFIGNDNYTLQGATNGVAYNSQIIDCVFDHAKVQPLGNFGTGLVFDDCDFIESNINAQSGNGITVKNSNFIKTLTATSVNDSFYVIRTNDTPVTVENCTISIDSELAEVADGQSKWILFWHRGTSKPWSLSDIIITMTDAAEKQTELKISQTAGGVITMNNVTLNGVVQ